MNYRLTLIASAMVAGVFTANAELRIWTGGDTAIDSDSYVKIIDDVGTFSGALRLVGFSTADGDYTITSNRLHVSATAGSAIGELPAGAYFHQISSGARFDGTATKSIRVQLAQPSGSTALYARITAVTTAAGDYANAEDLRSYLETHPGVGTSSTDAAVLAANAVTKIQVASVASSFLTWVNGSGTAPEGVTLGGGKMLVQCDAGGSVTNVVATPAGGEDLIVTGDAMAFAGGAKVTLTADGNLYFANDVTAAGALALTRSDEAFLAWTGNNTILKGTSNYDVNALPGKASVIDDYMFYSAFADPPAGSSFPRGTYQLTDAAPRNGGYALNLWKNGYTWSLRLQTAKAGNVDVHLRLATIVRQPFGVYEPRTDVWDTYYFFPNGLPDDAWWWFMSEKSGNTRHIKGGVYKGQAGNGSTGYSGVKRVVWRRKTASIATVGFGGNAVLGGTADIALGVKMAVLPKAGSTFAAPAYSGAGDVEYQRNATLSQANGIEYSSHLTVKNGAVVTVRANNAIPAEAIVNVYADSTLSINTTANQLAGGTPELCVHQGGRLFIEKTSAQHTFRGGKQCVVADGGTIWIAHDKTYAAGGSWKDSRTFMQLVTLLNGAQIKGGYANIGNNQPTQWMVVGDNQAPVPPVTVDAIGALGWTSQVMNFFVADITGDSAADCIVGGEIPVFEAGAHANYRYYTTQKDGDVILRLNGQWAMRGTVTVNGGGIVFGDNGGPFPLGADTQVRTSVSGKREFVLKNGSKLGKTAGVLELDALTVTGGGKLELGDTATMSFVDSSAKSWSGPLLIEGFREHAVRFGTSASGLTSAQVADIRAVTDTGRQRRVTISSQGYLRYPGFLMVVR
ncbi:MAG: hypothetical protein IJK04_04980 [Kiritimatiellae bacterium]|nr:hypothetical protein [Kiritimatiellia bacterium]